VDEKALHQVAIGDREGPNRDWAERDFFRRLMQALQETGPERRRHPTLPTAFMQALHARAIERHELRESLSAAPIRERDVAMAPLAVLKCFHIRTPIPADLERPPSHRPEKEHGRAQRLRFLVVEWAPSWKVGVRFMQRLHVA
jgi:hypothetical protein